jgi:signal peptidase I
VAAAAVVLLVVLTGALALKASSATLLVTRGASMKPAFSSGDLAILRPARVYRTGDVAAYRSTTLDRVVLHRIVAVNGATYTFKGDANSFVDPEPVARKQIVGHLAVRVPMLGGALLWLVQPFNTILVALLVALLVWDRKRLLTTFTKRQPAQTAPRQEPDRVVSIRDLRFPYELAVADVVDEAALRRLAEHYDRPVLYDEADGLLFVVESNMLFRCQLAGTAAPALSVVPIRAPEPADEPEPQWSEYDDAWIFWQPEWSTEEQQWTYRLLIWSDADQEWQAAPAEEPTQATLPKLEPGRMTTRVRVPSPQGRDWGYDDDPDDEPRPWLRWVR